MGAPPPEEGLELKNDDPIKMTRRTVEIEGGRRLYLYEFDAIQDESANPEKGGEKRGARKGSSKGNLKPNPRGPKPDARCPEPEKER